MFGVRATITRGARRVVMTSKMGNKNYYKGRRCNPTGWINSKGRFVKDPYREVLYVVPDMSGFDLKPYVTIKTDRPEAFAGPLTHTEVLAGGAAADAIVASQWDAGVPPVAADGRAARTGRAKAKAKVAAAAAASPRRARGGGPSRLGRSVAVEPEGWQF
mmetsp:Transcript_26337/g.69219  ORF Transcript_26337/g.69219 Transcript_26337/m.69219 type:complete len:160 (-) Transcript_26337:1518-1997(-)